MTATSVSPISPTAQMQANYTVCRSDIIINEINADTSGGGDVTEFIELYDGGKGNVGLDGHTLVLFNGNGDKSYFTVSLTGYKTDKNGYFLLGASSFNPDIVLNRDTVQNGPDGVALYLDSPIRFPSGTLPTTHRIVDAVVYGTRDAPDTALINALLQSNYQVNEDFAHHSGEESISRCGSQAQVHPESFVLTHPTPKQPNDCTGSPTPRSPFPVVTQVCQPFDRQTVLNTSAGIFISEVITDQETSGDMEFVELYDGGRGNVSLQDYVLYVVDGNSSQITCIKLSNYQTSASGFFVIGTSAVKPTPSIVLDVLDIDSGAVALYADQKYCRLYLSVQNLVDAVVFGSGPKIDTFLGILVPGYNAIKYSPLTGCSISRTENDIPLDLFSFTLQSSTPGQLNARPLSPSGVCGGPSYPFVLINEVNADDPETDDVEFLELYDGGVGNTSLDGLIVVFFNGNDDNDGSYLTIDLKGKQTSSKGFFIIGMPLVTPKPDLVIDNSFLQNGVDAIGIYYAQASR